ncbi:MAG: GTP-binding protein [Candidatus Absconditabacterales bacterium]
MNIRNFCIIAHIDHGKSTLADRMLEMTGTVRKIDHNQMLDRMDIEQERGITIKLTPARMHWKGVELNLIDTPGHVDFQYEVSRSLAAVEGAILLIDSSQGIQAQTLSVLYMAVEQGLEIIPVLNKIDLPAAHPERVAKEIEHVIGIPKEDILLISGKTGEGVEAVLDAIIEKIPGPKSIESQVSKALIFDCVYDTYKGVVAYIKMVEGSFKQGDKLYLIHTQKVVDIVEVGHFTPEYQVDKKITQGQIGYVVTGEKSVRNVQIGDTLILGLPKDMDKHEMKNYAVPGFKRVKPYVYAGMYPVDTNDYEKLKDSLEKLSLNDSAVEYSLEDSKALGFGFRCGFLGMLHMDIIKERLWREYGIETIFTIPTVVYLVKSKNLNIIDIKSGNNIQMLISTGLYKDVLLYEKYTTKISSEDIDDIVTDNTIDPSLISGEILQLLKPWIVVKSGSDLLDQGIIDVILEPIAEVEIVGPKEYAGNIMALCNEYRGTLKSMDYLDENRVVWKYELPFGEIIIDFYDRLKSATKGYATMNYEFKRYQEADLVKMDIWINNEKVEALSWIVHTDKAYYLGREVTEKLKTLIPKHLFTIPIQAGIGTKIIARETIPAMRKDVIAKCYGGDVTRKRKLLAKQKEGKKKMKALGNVNVPGDVFIKMVTRD